MGASETCSRRDECSHWTDSACVEVCRSMVTSRLNLLPPPLLPRSNRRHRVEEDRDTAVPASPSARLLLTRRRSTGFVWRARCSVPVCVFLHHRSRSIDASRSTPSKLKTAERGAAPDETSPSSYHHRDPERIFPTVTRRQQRCRNSVAVIKLHGGFGDRGADDHRLRELGSRLCGWATSPPVTVPGWS